MSETAPSVAYYGEPGAYSEQAALQHFGNKASLSGFRFLPEIFEAVEEGTDFGVIPIENSLEGPVTQTYDLLLNSDLTIIGEEIVRIDHCLIAGKGTTLGNVDTVYSHPQALGQCRDYLDRHKLNSVPFYDTAGSVRMLSTKPIAHAAAIASKRAAEIYKMKVLASGIQSNHHNYTRFIIIARYNRTSPSSWNKTSIAFNGKDKPGALFHALNCFASSGVNLLYIESRPISGMPWEYHFYVDCKGSILDKNVSSAVKKLNNAADLVKILGSYKSARFEKHV